MLAEREEIGLLSCQGVGVREIARRIGRSASTVSRLTNPFASLTKPYTKHFISKVEELSSASWLTQGLIQRSTGHDVTLA